MKAHTRPATGQITSSVIPCCTFVHWPLGQGVLWCGPQASVAAKGGLLDPRLLRLVPGPP